MDPAGSLRQTVTHLFDAVRYYNYAKEMERMAAETEDYLEEEMAKLENRTEELANVIASMEGDVDGAIKDLGGQLEGFLKAAKDQAKQKLEKRTKAALSEYRSTSSAERDKALKTLEAYLASEPLPVIERTVSVKLADGYYLSQLTCECEGGVKYSFGLSSQNSGLFHKEFSLAQMGHELRIPVRFSKPLLGKNRVPGFERLDHYVLASAENTGGKVRATFEKPGNGAKMNVVTSGIGDNSFVGIEYVDQARSVNVMNDASLSAHADLRAIQKAMGDLVKALSELSQKRVALTKLSFNGDGSLEDLNCEEMLKLVLKVMGSRYREVIAKISREHGTGEGLTVAYIRERARALGDGATAVLQSLGMSASG